jgi:hypothetical protein
MVASAAAPSSLSQGPRALTVVTAGASGVLGLLLFVAPGWAAPRFAWQVTDLMVMSIGAWFLGNSVWAARIARDWRWARWSSGLIYLWAFGVLQLAVLGVYADKVVTGSALALLYLSVIGMMAVAAVIGVVDVVRLRPSSVDDGPRVPRWLRIAVVAFIVITGYLFLVAILRPSAAVGGRIFPEDMSPFTVRSFGVYFLALVLGAVVLAVRPTLPPLLSHMEGGIGITAPILAAALFHLPVFDFGKQPGQWIYLGSYIAVLLISIPTVAYHRWHRRPGRAAAPATLRRSEAAGGRRRTTPS